MINPTTAQNMHQFYQDNPDEDPVYTYRSGSPVIKDGNLTIQNSSDLARSIEATIIDDKKTNLAKEEGLEVQVGSPEPEFVKPTNGRNIVGPEDRDRLSKYQRAADERSMWEKNSGLTEGHVANQGGHPMHAPVTTTTSSVQASPAAAPSVAAATTSSTNSSVAHTTQQSSQPAQAVSADPAIDPQLQAQLQELRAVAQDENASVRDRRAARKEIRAIRGTAMGDAPQSASMPSSGITAEDRAKIQDLRDVARNQDNPTKVRRQARQELKQIRREALSGASSSAPDQSSVRAEIQDLRDIARDESMPTSERRQARQQIKELRRTIATGSDGLQTQASSMPASASAPQGYKEKHASVQRQVQQTRRDAKERYGSMSREQLEAIVDPNTIQPATPGKAPFDYQLRQKAIQGEVQQARQAARAQVSGATTNPGAAAMPVQGEAMNQGVNAQIQDLRDIARNDKNSTSERRQARQQIKSLKRAKNAGMQEQANENIPVRQPVQGERFDDTPQEQIQRLRDIAQSDKSTVKERRQARQEIRALRREQQANRVASMQGEATQASSMPSQAQSTPNETRSSSQAPAGAPSPQGVGSNMTVAASASGSVAASPSAPSVNNGSPAATYTPSTGGYSGSSSGSIGDTAAARSGYGAPRTREDLTAPGSVSLDDLPIAAPATPIAVSGDSTSGVFNSEIQEALANSDVNLSEGLRRLDESTSSLKSSQGVGSNMTVAASASGSITASPSAPSVNNGSPAATYIPSQGGNTIPLPEEDVYARGLEAQIVNGYNQTHGTNFTSMDDPSASEAQAGQMQNSHNEWMNKFRNTGEMPFEAAQNGGATYAAPVTSASSRGVFEQNTASAAPQRSLDTSLKEISEGSLRKTGSNGGFDPGQNQSNTKSTTNNISTSRANSIVGNIESNLNGSSGGSDGVRGVQNSRNVANTQLSEDDTAGVKFAEWVASPGSPADRFADNLRADVDRGVITDRHLPEAQGFNEKLADAAYDEGFSFNPFKQRLNPVTGPQNIANDIVGGVSGLFSEDDSPKEISQLSGRGSGRRPTGGQGADLSKRNTPTPINGGFDPGQNQSNTKSTTNNISTSRANSIVGNIESNLNGSSGGKVGAPKQKSPGYNAKYDVGATPMITRSNNEVEAQFSHTNSADKKYKSGGNNKPGNNAMPAPKVEISSTAVRSDTGSNMPRRSQGQPLNGGSAGSGNAAESYNQAAAAPKKTRAQRIADRARRHKRRARNAADNNQHENQSLASGSGGNSVSSNQKQSFFKKINDVPKSNPAPKNGGVVVNAADSSLPSAVITPASQSKGFTIGSVGGIQ